MVNSIIKMSKKKTFKNTVDFSNGNIPDVRLEVKKSLPEAKRFIEPNQNKKVKQGGQIY